MGVTKQNFLEPFTLLLREGTIEDPYVDITETINLVITNNYDSSVYNIGILRELPLQTQGVICKVNGLIELTEIRDSETEINTTNFKVDYTNGRIYVDKSYLNNSLELAYKGRGVILVSGERILLSYGGQGIENIYTLDSYVQEHLGEVNVGPLSELHTVNKTKVVYAINETYDMSKAHIENMNNPHQTDKADIGLGNVDNTSDANKPVSTIQKDYIDDADSYLQSQIGALKGAYIYIGVISLNTADITQLALTNRAKELMETETLQGGWVLLDLEQHEWYYRESSTSWIDLGQANIYPATNSTYGTVKGGGDVSITNGIITVNKKEYKDIIATYETGTFNSLNFSVAGNYIVKGGTGFITGTPDDSGIYNWNITVLNSTENGLVVIAKNSNNNKVYMTNKYGNTWDTFWIEITNKYVSNISNNVTNFNITFNANNIWNNVGTPYTNKPIDMAQNTGYIPIYMPYENDTDTGIQVVFGTIGEDIGKIWMRRCDNGTWAEWKLVSGGGSTISSFEKLKTALEDDDSETKYLYIENDNTLTSNWNDIGTQSITVYGINYIYGNVDIDLVSGTPNITFIGNGTINFMNKLHIKNGSLTISNNNIVNVNRLAPDSTDIVVGASAKLYYETIVEPSNLGSNSGSIEQSNWLVDPYLAANKVYKTDGTTNLENSVISSDASIVDFVSCTQAEYDALTSPQRANKVFNITDEIDPSTDFTLSSLLNLFYPIGCIYESVNPENPSTLFGGTWVSWGAGKVSVGVDSSQTEFNTVEKTGGEKTHQLTTTEIATHNHKGRVFYSGDASWAGPITEYPVAVFGSNGTVLSTSGIMVGGENRYTYNVSPSSPYSHAYTMASAYTDNNGGNQSHNNLQPYITSYKWKRTA